MGDEGNFSAYLASRELKFGVKWQRESCGSAMVAATQNTTLKRPPLLPISNYHHPHTGVHQAPPQAAQCLHLGPRAYRHPIGLLWHAEALLGLIHTPLPHLTNLTHIHTHTLTTNACTHQKRIHIHSIYTYTCTYTHLAHVHISTTHIHHIYTHKNLETNTIPWSHSRLTP